MNLLREPFVHFLALGGLIFALAAWLAPADGSTSSQIVIDNGVIDSIGAR